MSVDKCYSTLDLEIFTLLMRVRALLSLTQSASLKMCTSGRYALRVEQHIWRKTLGGPHSKLPRRKIGHTSNCADKGSLARNMEFHEYELFATEAMNLWQKGISILERCCAVQVTVAAKSDDALAGETGESNFESYHYQFGMDYDTYISEVLDPYGLHQLVFVPTH
jgi:hypothetical protein